MARSDGATFGAYSFLSNVLTGASGIIVIRFLDPLSLGWWNSSQLLRVPLDVLRGGILSGMSREYPQLIGAGDTDEARRVLESGFAYTLATIVISQIVLAVVLLVVGREQHMLLLGLAASGIAWAIGSFSQHTRAMLRTSNQFLVMGKVGLIVAAVDMATVVLVWRFGYIGLLARSLISVTLTAILFRSLQPVKVRARFHWPVLRRLFIFGRHTFVTGFILLLGTNAERVLLLTLPDGVRLLGLYTPALLAMSLLQLVPGNLQSFHYPKIIQEFGRNQDTRILKNATVRLIGRTALFMLVMSIGVALAIVVLVRMFLPLYREGLTAAIIVCASGPFLASRMATTYFVALHRWPEYYVFTVLQCALPYVAIYVALSFLSPLAAAATGSVAAMAISGVTFVALLLSHSRRTAEV